MKENTKLKGLVELRNLFDEMDKFHVTGKSIIAKLRDRAKFLTARERDILFVQAKNALTFKKNELALEGGK